MSRLKNFQEVLLGLGLRHNALSLGHNVLIHAKKVSRAETPSSGEFWRSPGTI